MAVRHHRDLITWQLADEFKSEVIRLLKSSPAAWSDLRYRSQLVDCSLSVTANLVEGFRRFSSGEFPRFIDYSLASLGEAEQRLKDGIELGHFQAEACEPAFKLARRCLTAAIRLKQSQRRFKPKRRG
jgi:four helix bundle protein